MGHTQGSWTQDSAASDMRIFVGASEFVDVAALATIASAGPGLFSLNLAAAQAGTFFANLSSFARRTGVLATAGASQQQFGTAAGQPGPSAVAGTSGPLAQHGYPPMPAASMSTLALPDTGAPKKGMTINSLDVIYSVGAVDAAVATIGLTKTIFVDNIAPAVTSIITLGANGLVKTQRANPYVKNIVNASPVMITDEDTEVICNVNITTGAGGTAKFYGVNLYLAYNLN